MSAANMKFVKGEDLVGYFRAATIRGMEFTKKKSQNNAATMYTKCCGTWVCFQGPGWMLETNSHGLEGWERQELPSKGGCQPIQFFTGFEEVTGVKVPEGVPKGKAVDMSCCGIISFACHGIWCLKMCPCCAPCHGVCCCQWPNKLGEAPPAAAAMHRGKEIEYIGDQEGAVEKYLSKDAWGGNPQSTFRANPAQKS